jgi:hypothetical protein
MAMQVGNGLDLQNQRIQSVADPSSATDAATKQYVDNALAGLRWKQPVRVATTGNGTLATAYENGDTVDGITLATGDRILIKDQSTQTENGIYVVAASGAPTRATDADSSAELLNATVFVAQGTVNADRAYTQTANTAAGAGPVVGSDNIVFAQFGAGATYTADGNGLELSGTTFALELDGSTLSKSGSGLRIGSGAAGSGLTESSGVLAVGAGTGISVASDAVAVDSTVVRQYTTAIGDGSTTNIVVTHSLGTRDVKVAVRNASSPFEEILVDNEATSTTTVTLRFATAPTTGQYRCTVQGAA